MSDNEADVIEVAIEFIQQWDNGLYADRPKHLEHLRASVSALLSEHEGFWHRPEESHED